LSARTRTISKNIHSARSINFKKQYQINSSQNKKNKKIARTRRQRGYNWENTLVKRFNSLSDWKAFRLGSPSVALPDVLVVSNSNSTIFTIEAKSGTGTTLQVPFDQIIRCFDLKGISQSFKNSFLRFPSIKAYVFPSYVHTQSTIFLELSQIL